MKRHCITSRFLVEENDKEICFYTHTNPPGVITTTLWKYQVESRELHSCFEIRSEMQIWKYPSANEEVELQYVGMEEACATCVVGWDKYGKEIFKVELGKYVDSCGPVFDGFGNIYVCFGDFWIICLSPKGEILWKWKPIFAVPTRTSIEKYWIFNDKLYVIACKQLHVISVNGKMEKSYLFNEYFDEYSHQFIIHQDKILYVDSQKQELECYDFKAEKQWNYRVHKSEIMLRIVASEGNLICLKAMRKEDDKEIFYVIDESGQIQWSFSEDCTGLFVSPNQEIILADGKNMVLYDSKGQKLAQYSGKEYFLWGKLFEEKLVAIVEEKGQLAVVERSRDLQKENSRAKLTVKEDTEEIAQSIDQEKWLMWQDALAEYLMMNMEIWIKYAEVEMCEIKVSYELFGELQIQVLTNENVWVDGMASNIPYDQRSEDHRDMFKECSCREDIVWFEFCDDCQEAQVDEVMQAVCDLLKEQLGVPVTLQNQ